MISGHSIETISLDFMHQFGYNQLFILLPVIKFAEATDCKYQLNLLIG